MRLRLLPILLLAVTAIPCFAEDWTDSSTEHPPTDAQNRIIKWCKNNGTKTRYASANIKIDGYSPCGKLSAQAMCDPLGQRFIGSSDKVPYSYKDCKRGLRIFVKREGEELSVKHDPSKDGPITPLTNSEKRSLKSDIKKLSKKQSQNPIMALEKLLLQYLPNVVPGNSPNVPQISDRELQRHARELLKALDPKSQKLIEQMVGKDRYKGILD